LDPNFDKIFIKPETVDLQPIVPEYWRYFLARTDLKSREAAWQAAMDEYKMPTFRKAADPTRQAYSAAVVHSPDPNYTKEAAAHHIEGVSKLGVVLIRPAV
jgi:hypothetical protein